MRRSYAREQSALSIFVGSERAFEFTDTTKVTESDDFLAKERGWSIMMYNTRDLYRVELKF